MTYRQELRTKIANILVPILETLSGYDRRVWEAFSKLTNAAFDNPTICPPDNQIEQWMGNHLTSYFDANERRLHFHAASTFPFLQHGEATSHGHGGGPGRFRLEQLLANNGISNQLQISALIHGGEYFTITIVGSQFDPDFPQLPSIPTLSSRPKAPPNTPNLPSAESTSVSTVASVFTQSIPTAASTESMSLVSTQSIPTAASTESMSLVSTQSIPTAASTESMSLVSTQSIPTAASTESIYVSTTRQILPSLFAPVPSPAPQPIDPPPPAPQPIDPPPPAPQPIDPPPPAPQPIDPPPPAPQPIDPPPPAPQPMRAPRFLSLSKSLPPPSKRSRKSPPSPEHK